MIGRLDSAPWDTDTPQGRILRAIVESPWSCAKVSTLLGVAGIGEPEGVAVSALTGMIAAMWVVTWEPLGGPGVATLHPWGAERLGMVLIQPEQDGPNAEPRWGNAGARDEDDGKPGHFDRTGRFRDEPKTFTIQRDWGSLMRSPTPFDRGVKARAAKPVEPDRIDFAGHSGDLLKIVAAPGVKRQRPARAGRDLTSELSAASRGAGSPPRSGSRRRRTAIRAARGSHAP